MGWRGALRDIAAANRRAGRLYQQQRRQLLAQQQQVSRMQEHERAQYEVALYENYLSLITSVHKEVGNPWDWRAVEVAPPPAPPSFVNPREQEAVTTAQRYQPGLADKLLGNDSVTRQQLAEAVEAARYQDRAAYEQAVAQHREAYARWQWLQDIARGVNTGTLAAYKAVLDYLSPFSDFGEFGSFVDVTTEAAWYVDATIRVKDEEAIPNEERALTSTGKVSTKRISQGRYWGLYEDFVSGCALRVAREAFALLPIRMAFVHVTTHLLNPQTGSQEEQTVLSVAFERTACERLNFEAIDPSESLRNFVHNAQFKKGKGFGPVPRVDMRNFSPPA